MNISGKTSFNAYYLAEADCPSYLCTNAARQWADGRRPAEKEGSKELHAGRTNTHTHNQPNLTKTMPREGKREMWKYIINIVVSVLTALGTALGVTSCA